MTPRLLCFPCTHDLPDDLPGQVRDALEEMGLLGEAFDLEDETRFATGPAFLDHVAFLGCAPDIQLEPPSAAGERAAAARTGRFCHWRVTTLHPMPCLRTDPLAAPRCPGCGKPAPVPRTGVIDRITCPECGQEAPPNAWKWKQLGGHARFFLELVGIHTGEAVPGDTLLERLEAITNSRWGFAYVRD